MPSDTGNFGGKKTGNRMTHYIIHNGLFIEAFNKLKKNNNKYLPYILFNKKTKNTDKEPIKKDRKIKYTCSCGNNIWGKTDLSVICDFCKEKFKV